MMSGILLTTLILLGSLNTRSIQPDEKPNIIFILADDLGFGDVGFNGQELIKTPHIDQLAKRGMVFSQFYAGSTVCAPSRSALMSGQHTGHTFIRGNKSIGGSERMRAEGQYPIPDSMVTIAEALKSQGYVTGAFGKWGLGFIGSEGDPTNQGFDQFYGFNCQRWAHRHYPPHLWHNDQEVILSENGNLEYNNQYAPDLIQQEALSFVAKNKDRPFFLFLPYTLPHAELLVPNDSIFNYYKGKFPEEPYQGNDYGAGATSGGYASQLYPRATFAAMVSRLDLYVGQLVQQLAELGIIENTLIIFSSDNGPHIEGGADPHFFNSGGGLRGVKRDLYEGGIRVPFVATWPSQIKANQTSNHIGAFWDIFPTLVELAGGERPEHIDGISFVNTLFTNGDQQQHHYLYWEFHEQNGKQAVRYGKWKGIRRNVQSDNAPPIELYDLENDLEETRNLAAEHPGIVRQIEKYMEESHESSELFPFHRISQ